MTLSMLMVPSSQ